MSNFNQEQIEEMINLYKQGKSLREIGEGFNVCRETIKKIIQSNYSGYSCKKRISIPSENQTKKCTKCGKELPLDKFNRGNSLYVILKGKFCALALCLQLLTIYFL